MDSTNGKSCACIHHKINGFLVALAGLSYLLGNLDVISMHLANTIWPSLVILVGLNKSLGRGRCTCCTNP